MKASDSPNAKRENDRNRPTSVVVDEVDGLLGNGLEVHGGSADRVVFRV